MEVLTYIIQSTVWSVIGFAGGFFFGRAGREVHEIKETIVDDDCEERAQHLKVKDDTWRQVFGVTLMLLALITVGQAWYGVEKRRDLVNCQIEYNQAVAESFRERNEWAEEDRSAIINFFKTVYESPGDDQAEFEAFRRLINTSERNDRLRAKHPIPELPEATCP